jgi:hypothetical protein
LENLANIDKTIERQKTVSRIPDEITNSESTAKETPLGDRKLIIITGRCGRMANRTLLFAHFIGFAEEHGYRVMNLTFYSYAKLFEGTCRDVFCRYLAAQRESVQSAIPWLTNLAWTTRIFFHAGRLARTLNERFGVLGRNVVTLRQLPGPGITLLQGPEVESRIRPAKIVLVDGWKLRASDCVEKHAEKIRRYFQPISEIDREVCRFMERTRQNAQIVIGVHIRHGDYRQWKNGKYFFPASRYADWMRELMLQFSGAKVSFLVCSDEPRSPEEFAGLPVVISRNSPIVDLYALAKCDYIFGPQSTFSQWASFHGNTPLFLLGDTNDRLDRAQFRVSWL